MHKSEQNSLRPQTCRCVQHQQKLILKVVVTNVITNLIMISLTKQLASDETLYHKVSLQK